MSAILFSSAIGPVPINCVISEKPSSELDITEIPVETGVKITDHAIVLPKKVSLDLATANAAASYNALVSFQESRIPFTLVTGLSVFPNMLIKGIFPERDATFSTVLKARVELQEIIIVGTAYAADPGGDTSERGKAGGKKSTRAAAPTSNSAKDAATANRASQTTQLGDAAVSTASPADASILSTVFGPQ